MNLDSSGTARALFTVTNTSAQALRGRLLTRPSDPAKPEWFSIVGESVRDFAPNASEQVVVQLEVPAGSPPGSVLVPPRRRLGSRSRRGLHRGAVRCLPGHGAAEPKKTFPWWIVIAAAGAVVLLIVIGVVVWLLVRDDGTAAVPAVVGQPEPAAQTMLKDAGFDVKSLQVGVNDPAQIGVVQTQDPAAGTEKPKQTEVTINVGLMSRVPDVTGQTEARAKEEIARANLSAEVREGRPVEEQRELGVVQRQGPPGETLRPPGTVVTIFVGRLIEVPDVLQLTEGGAVAALGAAGLRARVINRRPVPPELDDLVLEQHPPPRAPAPPRITVELVVGRCLGLAC